jgi:hypothetical protein
MRVVTQDWQPTFAQVGDVACQTVVGAALPQRVEVGLIEVFLRGVSGCFEPPEDRLRVPLPFLARGLG